MKKDLRKRLEDLVQDSLLRAPFDLRKNDGPLRGLACLLGTVTWIQWLGSFVD